MTDDLHQRYQGVALTAEIAAQHTDSELREAGWRWEAIHRVRGETAERKLAAIRELHWHQHADMWHGGQCYHCHDLWPCETRRIVDGDL